MRTVATVRFADRDTERDREEILQDVQSDKVPVKIFLFLFFIFFNRGSVRGNIIIVEERTLISGK